MSDRDFAKLQMQRDAPGTHSVVRRRLTQQINAELERRKVGPSPPEMSSGTPEQAGKAAQAKWGSLASAARRHSGIVSAGSEPGVSEVHFPVPVRAAGFLNEMVSAGLRAERDGRTVRVRKPGASPVAPDRPKRVAIDVVSKGNALIVAGEHQARVGRDGNRFYVEDVDSEQILGHSATFKGAAKLAAKKWGFLDLPIELDRE